VVLSVLAVIPARGGSKGIPRKNIKPLWGKPLIQWTIDAAKHSKHLDRIIVSTEDPEIARISSELGADVPFVRPSNLATDDTPGLAPVLHALEQLPEYEWIMLLQPTSPLRITEDIDSAFELCQAHGAPAAVSVSISSDHPYWTYRIGVEGRMESFIVNRPDIPRRQDLPPAYGLNGAIYLARTDWLREQECFVTPETLGYVMPPERSIDLDSPLDWQWLEFLLGNKHVK
jgi:CMP-N,N'-diacetyllegionaminic acid synthase